MSQYSEMMGSFVRTGNYPMEANYIFESEEALKEFYTDQINSTTLHKGLFRIVASENTQVLYWVISVNGELIFKPLIESDSIDKLFERVAELRTSLNQEIKDREDSILEIVGTNDMSDFQEGLSNLLSISNAIKELQKSDFSVIPAIVGTDEEDLLEYLKTLDYNNLTDISNLLHKFFDTVDTTNSEINTLPELQEFLSGLDCSHSLKQQLDELVNALTFNIEHRTDNLQTELNQTQVGVGLSQDGSFSPDQETNYLKNATSVMNALKTLDSLVAKALRTSKLIPIDTNSILMTVDEDVDSSNISADVRIANDSDIIVNNDGLYTKLTTEYLDGILTIRVNGNIRAQHLLAISSVVDNAYYDQETESLVITFRNSQEVIIPVDKLIEEWVVDNPDNKVVEISRERVIAGTDKLSADVRIDSSSNNILKKVGNTLSVDGRSSNITHNGNQLNDVLEELNASISDFGWYEG